MSETFHDNTNSKKMGVYLKGSGYNGLFKVSRLFKGF
jgi:hypothetical protein